MHKEQDNILNIFKVVKIMYVTLNTLCQIAVFSSFGSKWTMRMAAVITEKGEVFVG